MMRGLLARRPVASDLIETAVLLVSEVVTNALLHAGTDIDVRRGAGRLDGLRVEVGDGSPHLPSRRRYAATAGTGRGLLMLESMVDDWGVTRHRAGKTVWFRISGAGDDRDGRPSSCAATDRRRSDGAGATTCRSSCATCRCCCTPRGRSTPRRCCASTSWPASTTDGDGPDPDARRRHRRDRRARGARPAHRRGRWSPTS